MSTRDSANSRQVVLTSRLAQTPSTQIATVAVTQAAGTNVPISESASLPSEPLESGKRDGQRTQEDPEGTSPSPPASVENPFGNMYAVDAAETDTKNENVEPDKKRKDSTR